MTRNFRRWEMDPFFAAAEDVQESADRLESAYRTWIYLKGLVNDPEIPSSVEFQRRQLHTALGAAKWQLEEFERATLTEQIYAGEDAPVRHKQFVEAIRKQIFSVENDLLSSEERINVKVSPVITLGDHDNNDLALFLSGTRPVESNLDKDGFAESSVDNYASTTVFDEETKEEAPSTSSGSREIKVWASSQHNLPAWNEDRICNITELRNCDSQSSFGNFRCEVKQSGNVYLHGREPLGKLDNGFLDLRSELGDHPVIEHLPEDKYGIGDDRFRGNVVGRRSASVDSDLNSWKVGSLVKATREKLYESWRTEGLDYPLAFLNKKKQPPEIKISKSGLKRWKDGDVDSNDWKRLVNYFRCNGRPKDVEMGLSSNYFGGKMKFLRGCTLGARLNREDKQFSGCREAFQRGLQCTQSTLALTRPVQLASAILVALGVIGLLSFYAIGAL